MNADDTRLWRVVAHSVEEAQAKRDWPHGKNVLIDETSSKRGHRYVTNFVDATTRKLLLMVEGHGVDAIAAFHGALAEHNGDAEKIELLSMDMKPAFIAGAHRYFPKAEVVFDHFHIMQMVGKDRRPLEYSSSLLRISRIDESQSWGIGGFVFSLMDKFKVLSG